MSTSLANDLALALDPVLVLQRMGMEADEWQERLLRSGAKRILVNIHRQAGKSTIVGALAAHTAVYQPNSLILLFSRGLRQSQELFRKTLDAYHTIAGPAPADSETKLTLELANRSRIALPGNEETIRGYSGVRLLLIDEASRVTDDLYKSIRPMLAVSGGRLIAPSTCFGKRGWWYEAWESDEAWERYKVPVSMCPRISPEFLAEERRSLGPWWYQQEYECRFLQPEGAMFDYESIEALLDPGVRPIFPILHTEGDDQYYG